MNVARPGRARLVPAWPGRARRGKARQGNQLLDLEGSAVRKHTAIVRGRRQPGEIPTARVAIRNHCLECCGYVAEEIRACTAPSCWLYPWRMGQTPDKAKGQGETIDFLLGNPGKIGGYGAQEPRKPRRGTKAKGYQKTGTKALHAEGC